MPEPRFLGNVARAVMEAVMDVLDEHADEYFELVVMIDNGDKAGAIQKLKEIASENNAALKSVNFLLADKPGDAEKAIMKVRMKRKDRG